MQLCKIATSFDILDEYWKLDYTYYPRWCKSDINEINLFNDYKNNNAFYLDEKGSSKSEEEMNNFLNDFFGKNIDKNIFTYKNEWENSLKWKKLISTIKNFKNHKLIIRVWDIKANVLKGKNIYNIKVASLLEKVNNEFKIDSIKNDFAKNINNLSYSLSTYTETSDIEVKKVFKKQLIKDLQNISKKYETLKLKDKMISITLEKRGQL
jgi:hypothetical protein